MKLPLTVSGEIIKKLNALDSIIRKRKLAYHKGKQAGLNEDGIQALKNNFNSAVAHREGFKMACDLISRVDP